MCHLPAALHCCFWDNQSRTQSKERLLAETPSQKPCSRHTERVPFGQGPMTSVRVELWGSRTRNGRCRAGFTASSPPGRLCGLAPELLLESKQSRFLSLTLLLVWALGHSPSRMLLIQTHDALEQALLAGVKLLPLGYGKRSQRLLWLAAGPPLIERDHNSQAHKADHEPISCYPEE